MASDKRCPLCGAKSLPEKRGEYRMELPPNLAGGEIVVSDAIWLHCDSCGEDILAPDMEKAINKKSRRKASTVG